MASAALTDELLDVLIHDSEIEVEDGSECLLPLGDYNEGILVALRELKERRSNG